MVDLREASWNYVLRSSGRDRRAKSALLWRWTLVVIPPVMSVSLAPLVSLLIGSGQWVLPRMPFLCRKIVIFWLFFEKVLKVWWSLNIVGQLEIIVCILFSWPYGIATTCSSLGEGVSWFLGNSLLHYFVRANGFFSLIFPFSERMTFT